MLSKLWLNPNLSHVSLGEIFSSVLTFDFQIFTDVLIDNVFEVI